ncbi:MAG: F0F1 ATP synthase subunit epsilon [Minisyncoccia bacterium]
MSKTFHLTIAKVGENLFEGEVVSVSMPGVDGVFEVLAHHEALVSELTAGQVRVISADNQTHRFAVGKGGVAEVSHGQVTVLL